MSERRSISGMRAVLLLLISGVAAAQEQPKTLRFDLTPLVGYRTDIILDTQPQFAGSRVRAVLEASPSYGVALGMRLDEENLVEFRWARQDTHVHVEGAVEQSRRQHVTLDQFHGDFTHEYILEGHPWARAFVMGSVGATHVSGSAGTSSFTRFSFGLGGGIKVFPSRHFGFRAQAEWLPLWINPEVNAFVCGAGCVVHLGGVLSSQGEFAIGPVFRF